MERSPATPLIVIVEPEEACALPLLLVLGAAGYATAWYRSAAALLAEALDVAPDVVVLAGTHPAPFDAWHAARELHALDAAVILATGDAAARCEVGTTPRGAACVDAVCQPYEPTEVLLAVRRAIAQYPANLRRPLPARPSAAAHRPGWRAALHHLIGGSAVPKAKAGIGS